MRHCTSATCQWRVEPEPDKESITVITDEHGWVGECRAEFAPLIANAPAMLDALRYVLPSIAVPKAYERAVAAIAKAEGRK